MMETIKAIQSALMTGCLLALVILVGIVGFVGVFGRYREAWRSMSDHSAVGKVLAVFAVVSCILYGGTKAARSRFTFEPGLLNDGSYSTNDLVHVEWVKSGTPYVSDAATLYVDYREIGSTNEWELLAESTVGEYMLDINLKDATNYNFNVWWYYKPEDVHTNGVWMYKAIRAKGNDPSLSDELKSVPVRAKTVADGKVLSTPGQKEENQ